MVSAKIKLRVCIASMVILAGCGAPGVPEPPSLELARPVTDLQAVRKGNEVRLVWTVPTQTTDHHLFRHVGPTEICGTLGTSMPPCGTPLAELATPKGTLTTHVRGKSRSNSSAQSSGIPHASYTDQLSPGLEMQAPTSNFVYAVNVLNAYGKSAGLSNQVAVPSAPTLAAPTGIAVRLSEQGVTLTWEAVAVPQAMTGIRFAYRVYRREVPSNKDVIAGEISIDEPHPSFLDSSLEWEMTYQYRVTVVTFVQHANGTEQVEGDDSQPVEIVAHDVFPPATPSGLQAVFSGPGQKPFIDLVWAPDPAPDLAGYNVYRHERDAKAVKINSELVKTPEYRDSDVLPGHEYFYSVSAVDVRGNESRGSEEASETVPADQ